MLTVEGTAPDLFITHKVTSGESLSGIGRKYNQKIQAIVTFNALSTDKGLLIGQTIKIPLTAQNLSASSKSETGETLIPLYHVVEKSETLFRISANSSVPLPEVRQWNNLSSDKIAVGTPLIVGHLKVANKQTSNLKNNGVAPADNTNASTPVETFIKLKPAEEIKKVEEQKAGISTPAKKSEGKRTEVLVATPMPEEKKQETVVVKTEATPAPVLQKDEPALSKPVSQEMAPMKEETKKLDLLAPEPEVSNEGVFSAIYSSDVSQKSLANKMGEAATFKSTSGWQDKKYYVLMNDILPGTILKIASIDNKFVFAKVLGSMPEMKENKGLLLRLSNAAATYLGMVDAKFPVQVSFYQ